MKYNDKSDDTFSRNKCPWEKNADMEYRTLSGPFLENQYYLEQKIVVGFCNKRKKNRTCV